MDFCLLPIGSFLRQFPAQDRILRHPATMQGTSHT
jgi:hypothetical protein